MSHEKRNAVVLLVDGLNPAYLSAHGCTWINTPVFDQLAAESLVFERTVTESVDGASALRAFLNQQHPASAAAENGKTAEGLLALAEAKVQCVLLTDDRQAITGVGDWFDEIIELGHCDSETTRPASNDVGETFLAQCFAGIISELPKQSSPFLAVIHLTSLARIWDAPVEMREQYRDEEDPEALDVTQAVCDSGDFDPDQILGITHAYGAQLETLDTCLDVFLQEMQLDGLWDNTRLMLAGLRGYPLGHRGQIGHHQDHLFSDATRVPLWVRPAKDELQDWSGARTQSLSGISTWIPMATSWILGIPNESVNMTGESLVPPQRNCVIIRGSQTRAIWTPAWLMVESAEQTRLFVKPEDRWDVNPIQDRCRGIAEDLCEILGTACEKLQQSEPFQPESLADELVFGLD